MSSPLYNGFNPPDNYPSGGHAGLWYDRFFDAYDPNGAVPGAKLKWIKKITLSPLGGEKVGQFVMRQMELIDSLGGKSIVAKTDWHFVTGMGINHPVENGFAWHPTLGVPYLTGAAVKGLLRAWCEQWSSEFEKLDEDKKAEKLRDWFGPSFKELKDKTNKIEPAVGNLIFFDAIPTNPVQLQADVMTPHYDEWYEEGGGVPNPDGSNVPADWHNPVPVPFLAVAPGQSFLFSISARPGCNINLDSVLQELKDALEWLGAGAKTAVGYGRMTKDEADTKRLEGEYLHQKEILQKREEELLRQREIENLPPFERSIAKLLAEKHDPNMKDYVLLLKKLEENHWPDENDKKQVAEKIRGLMQAATVWKEKSIAKKPEKDSDYQNTLKVLKYLL